MRTIALMLPYHYQLFSVASILEVFNKANKIVFEKKKEISFNIVIVQSKEQIKKFGKKFYGHSVRSVNAAFSADTILIPSIGTENIEMVIDENRAMVKWLQKQFREGAEIASFCTGAYLFAASGLLNSKLATTHVDACPQFILKHPLVYVKPGRTLTIDERCYTSGGGTSAFHLLIFLIQKYCGNDVAVRISKIFSIDLNRYQQTYFSTFRPDYSHNDEMVKKLQKKIETNYLNIHTIEEIIKDFPSSRRNIVRRFKNATGTPPIEYLQHIRIEKAKKQLEQTNLSIAEIINNTGYIDPKSFRKIFLKLVGITPFEYRDKFKMR